MMKNPKNDGMMMAVKMPVETMDFVKNNPQIAQITAPMLMNFRQAKLSHDKALELFLDGKAFESFLSQGYTLEDLRKFLKAALDAFTGDGVIAMEEGNEEEFDKLQQKLRDKVGEDRIVTTKCGYDKKDEEPKITGLKIGENGSILGPDGKLESGLN